MMIGMPDSARISLQTSRPDSPGSIRSSSTRSGCTSRNASSALDPSRTTAVSKPSPRSTMVSISARAGSSSTTNTRALMPSMVTSRAGERRVHRAGIGADRESDRSGSRSRPDSAPWDHGRVSMPQYPSPEPYGRPGAPAVLGAAGPDPAAAADGRRDPRRRRSPCSAGTWCRSAARPCWSRRCRTLRHARHARRHRRAADLRRRAWVQRPARAAGRRIPGGILLASRARPAGDAPSAAR